MEDHLLHQPIEKYLPILIRKYKQMIYKNEYGYIDEKRWQKELKYISKEIIDYEIKEALTQCIGYFDEFWYDKYRYNHWIKEIDSYFKSSVTKLPKVLYKINSCVTGEDYEYLVAELIKYAGWHVELTPVTNDFGADILASNGNLTIAIQCKYFSSSVPNKAVQEIYSAKDYYNCDYACIVSNAAFTSSAQKQLTN